MIEFERPNIFEYTDYRKFLKDYFEFKKKLNKNFSYRYFCQKAGVSSPSYLHNIIKGIRRITPKSIDKIIKGLGFLPYEANYFRLLVNYCESTDEEEKEIFAKEMERIRETTRFYTIKESQEVFYRDWYIPVIRELMVSVDWKNDYKFLASLLYPPITEEQAKEAVEILLNTGLVSVDENGRYYEENELLTGRNVNPKVIKNIRKQYFFRALEASENLPPDQRHFSFVTLAVDDETYKEITHLIDELRERILTLALNQKSVNKVIHVNFQVFPLTKDLKEFNLKHKSSQEDNKDRDKYESE